MKSKLSGCKASITASVAAAVLVLSTGAAQYMQAQDGSAALEALQVRPNFYMIAGAGGNIAVQIGTDGVVLVNAGTADAADRVVAAIKKLTDQPIRYILDTSPDADFVGGNAKLAKAGRSILATGTDPFGGEFGKTLTNNYSATIMATVNLLQHMSAPTGKISPFPTEGWPTEPFAEKRKAIYFNHEAIELLSQRSAHSDGDCLVFFRGSDVVAAGDVIDANRFPFIDVAHGGSIQGEIDALNRVVELAVPPIPFVWEGGGTIVVPGHGRLYDHRDAVEYRDMVVIIGDVIKDMIQRGMTLDQIKEARPAEPYESEFGATSGLWTTNDFVTAVYKGLTTQNSKKIDDGNRP